MKFKNKFLILSLLFSFISCNLFFGLKSNKDAIEENSESLEHVDSETSKQRGIRSVLEEAAEVVEPVLKAFVEPVLEAILEPVVAKPVVVDAKEEEKIVVAAEVGAEEESEENKEVEEKDVEDLEVKLQLNKDDDVRDVKYALYWIKAIKEKKSDIMYEVLAIAGGIELLKKIVSQKYKQKDKANDIMQLLDNSRQMIHNIMRSSYEYNEESFSELEANFTKSKKLFRRGY
ncbi:hypothetical protein BDCR2A_01902 [Borrelia duttonii CR2A]|uniref:Uncharacterized protein n=1 Tax=Borrelia duttonii CR2A TaxID=1432657 RepID=W6TVW7_9SPIR|nr:hypothetical protein [Borrelia duttonii]ETZ17181.1 hypothetical protein BDCR2A_01902 [Borrelia duttonii CR2A]